jgi:hypothetical protein
MEPRAPAANASTSAGALDSAFEAVDHGEIVGLVDRAVVRWILGRDAELQLDFFGSPVTIRVAVYRSLKVESAYVHKEDLNFVAAVAEPVPRWQMGLDVAGSVGRP